MNHCDDAFNQLNGYSINDSVYDIQRKYEYNNFRGVKSLLKLLLKMVESNDPHPEVVWNVVAKGTSKPIISIEATCYDDPYKMTMVDFLVDTGSDVTILTFETANQLGININSETEELITLYGLEGQGVPYTPCWIYISLAGKLHPIPVLVQIIENLTDEEEDLPSSYNLLGRAAITNCFLMCFDNKRLYTFSRFSSEPLK